MPMITDRAERRRLAKLEQRVRQLDIAIQAATDDLAVVGSRETALRDRLGREEARKPVDKDEAMDAAADTLLANPEASTVTLLERLTGSRRKRDDSLANWRAGIAPIKAAIAKAGWEQEKRQKEITDLKAERSAAWETFADATMRALASEFERRVEQLHDEVYAPLEALRQTSKPKPDYARPSPEFAVELHWHDERGHQSRTILPRVERVTYRDASGTFNRLNPVDPQPYLAKLRAELAAERG